MFSTVATLMFVPVVFSLVHKKQDRPRLGWCRSTSGARRPPSNCKIKTTEKTTEETSRSPCIFRNG